VACAHPIYVQSRFSSHACIVRMRTLTVDACAEMRWRAEERNISSFTPYPSSSSLHFLFLTIFTIRFNLFQDISLCQIFCCTLLARDLRFKSNTSSCSVLGHGTLSYVRYQTLRDPSERSQLLLRFSTPCDTNGISARCRPQLAPSRLWFSKRIAQKVCATQRQHRRIVSKLGILMRFVTARCARRASKPSKSTRGI